MEENSKHNSGKFTSVLEEQSSNQKPFKWKTIVAVAIVTALVVGGGVYAWQRSVINNIRTKQEEKAEQLQEQINKLENQIQDLKTKEIPKSVGETVSCKESSNPSNCYQFLDSLLSSPLSSDLVNSNEKLKEYFKNNLDQLEFTGISRGKFDKYSDKKVIIVSFRKSAGKHFHSYTFIIKERTTENWQATFRFIGYFRKFINEPKLLVKGEPPFFIVKNTPMGGTCVPVRWSISLVRLQGNHFKSIWDTVYHINGRIEDNQGKPRGKVRKLNTEISYKDLDGDGNSEIIKQGISKLCQGRCYTCEKTITEKKVYQVFKWNSKKQNFVKK